MVISNPFTLKIVHEVKIGLRRLPACRLLRLERLPHLEIASLTIRPSVFGIALVDDIVMLRQNQDDGPRRYLL
jgi:hypothetical protein